jgi:hypothetical protein
LSVKIGSVSEAVAVHSPAESPDWAVSSWIQLELSVNELARGVVNWWLGSRRPLLLSETGVSVTPGGPVTTTLPSRARLCRYVLPGGYVMPIARSIVVSAT